MGKKLKLGFLAMVGVLGVAAFSSPAKADEWDRGARGGYTQGYGERDRGERDRHERDRYEHGRFERERFERERFAHFDRDDYRRERFEQRGRWEWIGGGWRYVPVSYFRR